MKKTLGMTVGALCGAVGIFGGCSIEDVPHDDAELARIEGPAGGHVRWLAPTVEGDEPEVEIVALFPDRPLLAPEFVAERGAIDAYLALVPDGEPLPEALSAYAPADVDAIDRAALAEANVALLDRAFADAPTNPPSATWDAAACDAPFKNWVRSAYGKGYGDTSTCSTNDGFTEQTWTTYYCEPGPGNDCKYPIGGLDACYPAADESCSNFEGDLRVARARHHLYSNAYYQYNMWGHRYRFAAANCWGSGDMNMWRQRGGAGWTLTTVAPRSMAIRVGGRSHLPAAARVRDVVAWALWKEVVPMGGSSYKKNQLVIDPLPGSPGGYACADVQRRFETYDGTWSGCNGYLSFCDDDSCDNCWD